MILLSPGRAAARGNQLVGPDSRGRRTSGDAFNSLVFDERYNRPYNAMVNAGALIATDMVRGGDDGERLERILEVMRRASGNGSLAVDEDVFQAEMRTADRNRATAYLMRSDGMLAGDVEATLALYLRQCSVVVSCRGLAVMAATLANGHGRAGAVSRGGQGCPERDAHLRHVRGRRSVGLRRGRPRQERG